MKKAIILATALMLGTSIVSAQTNNTTTSDSTADTLAIDQFASLCEVVVKGQIPNTKLKGNAMVTRIDGTVLAKSGTAEDMLAKVPGMAKRGDDLEVLGKGKPVFYVNGRKMTDIDELKRLHSDEIQEVEVITNPGALYDATVTSVVRIRTKKRQGDGFGFDISGGNNQDLGYGYSDPSATLNLHYRHNSLDFFGMVNYWKWDSVNDSYPEQTSYMSKGGNLFSIHQNTHLRHDWHGQGLNYNLGFNWQISQNHSVGLRIERHDKFNSGVDANIVTDMQQRFVGKESPTTIDHSESVQTDKQHTPYNWDGNAYYNGKVGKLGIDLNVDFLTSKANESNTIQEWSNISHDLPASSIYTQEQHTPARMWATKLILSYPIWKGTLQAGTEMSFVTRANQYSISGHPLPSTDSEVKEKNLAGFIEYSCAIPKFGNVSAGVRYEHVGMNYTDNISASNNLTRNTDDFFPSLSWSQQFGPVQTALSYSFRTIRPQYSMLDESIIYINSYSFQQGDPKLKNATMQEVSLNARYKWINLFAAYERRDNALTQWSYIYNDEGVILVKNINFPEPMRNFAAFLTASPTFGCYSPNWTVGWQKYFVSQSLADPREASGQRTVSFNKPIMFFDINNTIRLKHSWQFEANLNMMLKGDAMNFHMLNNSYNLSFVVQKCWLKNDALCLRASVADVLQKSTQKVQMDCGYYTLDQNTHNNRHRLDITLRYSFNASNNKYKGTGAGKDAASRMKDE